MNGMITMVMQRAAVAKDTMSAAAKLAKEFEWWHLVSHTTTTSSHEQGVDRLAEQHVSVARTCVED